MSYSRETSPLETFLIILGVFAIAFFLVSITKSHPISEQNQNSAGTIYPIEKEGTCIEWEKTCEKLPVTEYCKNLVSKSLCPPHNCYLIGRTDEEVNNDIKNCVIDFMCNDTYEIDHNCKQECITYKQFTENEQFLWKQIQELSKEVF